MWIIAYILWVVVVEEIKIKKEILLKIVENYILNSILMVALFLLSIEDIRHKSIRLWELIISIGIAVSYSYFSDLYGLKYIVISILIFCVLLWANAVTKCFGTADILVIFILNCVKGIVFSIIVFGMAITLAAVVNIVLYIKKKVGLKSTIPFIPYIGICTLGAIICV